MRQISVMQTDIPLSKFAVIGSSILFCFSAFILFLAAMARIDTPDELWHIRVIDVIIGMMFAGSVMLFWLPRRTRDIRTKALGAWVAVSGSLLLFHQLQVQIRWAESPKMTALDQIYQIRGALGEYARDVGDFPTEVQGLKVLCDNPGDPKWKGAYLGFRKLKDPWGNPLRYTVTEKTIRVWSLGRDGLNDTTDDIVQTWSKDEL